MEMMKSMMTSVLEPGRMIVSLAEVRNAEKRFPRVESSKLGYGKNEFEVPLGV